jgi:hypothetical protein
MDDLKALAKVPDGETHRHGHIEHSHPGIWHRVSNLGDGDGAGLPPKVTGIRLEHRKLDE